MSDQARTETWKGSEELALFAHLIFTYVRSSSQILGIRGQHTFKAEIEVLSGPPSDEDAKLAINAGYWVGQQTSAIGYFVFPCSLKETLTMERLLSFLVESKVQDPNGKIWHLLNTFYRKSQNELSKIARCFANEHAGNAFFEFDRIFDLLLRTMSQRNFAKRIIGEIEQACLASFRTTGKNKTIGEIREIAGQGLDTIDRVG